MPAVSVIIPTYNRATLVREAIDSVLNQTLEDWEVIVVDDGSTDGTGNVLSGYHDPRVKPFYQPNGGRSLARNRGIGRSSGRYLLFLDSDDLLLPQALEYEASYLDAHPDVDVVYTDGFFCDKDGQDLSRIALARRTHDPESMLERLVVSNVILACHSAMVRRSALDSVGPPYFDEALRGTEDENLWIRLAARGSTFAYLDVLTCKYRVHDNNASKYDLTSPAHWRRREVVKQSRFKILSAEFFPGLGIGTREEFFRHLLLFQLEGDEPARQRVLESTRFAELPAAVRGRLLYHLGVRTIVDQGDLVLGRRRLGEATSLAPRKIKYLGSLLLAQLGRLPLSLVIAGRRWLNSLGKSGKEASPIGHGGLRAVD